MRHAEQIHYELARDGPVDRAIPQYRRDALVVDASLLIEAARVEQVDGGRAQLRLGAEPATHAARDDAGETVKIEAAAATGEPVRVAIPPLPGERRQLAAQAFQVQAFEARVITLAEDLEEVLEGECADRCDLQFEQGVLARIRVDTMNALRCAQGIVERVAAGAGDDQDYVTLAQRKRLLIDGGIFPAGVVDQAA